MVEIETRRMGFHFMSGRKKKLMKKWEGVSDWDWNKKKWVKIDVWKKEEIEQKVGEERIFGYRLV